MPNEIKLIIRGSIREHMQGIRAEIPSILTPYTRAVKDAAASKSPGGSAGKVGGSLIDIPAMQVGPDTWESGIASYRPKLVFWHEFGTGERKEGGGERYRIVATKPHRMLVFEKEGVTRFIRGKGGAPAVVRHPGVKASRMIRDAMKQHAPTLIQAMVSLGIRVRGIGGID